MISKDKILIETIDKIRTQDTETLTNIYQEVYPMIEKYIIDNSGSREDAKDIFQDSMFLLIKKVESAEFELRSKLSTFLYGIAKNLWLKKLTGKKLDASAYKVETDYKDEENDDFQLRRVQVVKAALDLLGEPCRTIIVEFYYFRLSMEEIAEKFHYANPETAKNQKYKCLMRLKKLITRAK
ncbi:sigma-70 family RNA polymerase sigma factor [Crocinitomix catalasitica]|nr:sigma-70 family RNA polymerase sigma factor [Crocinitomix catalasitica]